MSVERIVSKYIDSAKQVLDMLGLARMPMIVESGKVEEVVQWARAYLEDAEYYRGEYQISQGLFELAEKRQEERDERRRQRVYAGLEGGRVKKMHSRSYYKKCTHKMRTYKKK